MDVTYFRNRRIGPEATVEDAVARSLPSIFPQESDYRWAGGSVPLGAGLPDLVLVSCHPQVIALAHIDLCPHEILGYLRAVRSATLETIADRVDMPLRSTQSRLQQLCEFDVIMQNAANYSLSKNWRNILPEVITIEVKVKDWKTAVQQASRNRILAHQSYIAVPEKLAIKIANDEIFETLGVGVLSVNFENEVSIVKRAESVLPRVWSYYYKLATLAASNVIGDKTIVSSRSKNSSGTLSRV